MSQRSDLKAIATIMRDANDRIQKMAKDYADLVLLTAWMAENNYDAAQIAYAVEKPWKYEGELAEAKAEQERGE